MDYAPIVIFAFNRLTSLMRCIDSLQTNEESNKSDLFVFVDGARSTKEDESELVDAVQNYVKGISGFKSLHYEFSKKNKGLGNSVIDGVTKVINEYGCAIVLEDDLEVSQIFLKYMNISLYKYMDDEHIYSICGYSNLMNVPHDYQPNTYFCTRSSSWGWATWKDRWNTVDWNIKDWRNVVKDAKPFNRWGGSDLYKMIKDWHTGKNNSWAIRFVYSQFRHHAISLFPVRSLINNGGFDGTGTNCRSYSRFKCDFDNAKFLTFIYPANRDIDSRIFDLQMRYNSIPLRIWSRIMYIIYDIKRMIL